MRLLSKLRHPNITTVMGAVLNDNLRRVEPLLVIELMVCRREREAAENNRGLANHA